MKSALRRRRGYTDRMQSSLIDPTLTATNDRQKLKHAAHIAALYPQQLALRAYLDAQGLSGTDAFQLEALSSECYALSRRFAGPAARAYALSLAKKYSDLGVTDAHICHVLTAVWSIGLATPAQVTLVTPVNGAPAEPKSGTLTWLAAANATGYDVWLGPNAGPVVEVSHNQPGITYAYAGLAGLTLHDWYIVSRNVCGTGTPSVTWQFTTVA